jgi:hypothetical protein
MEYTTILGIQLRPSCNGLETWATGGWMCGGLDDESAVPQSTARSTRT